MAVILKRKRFSNKRYPAWLVGRPGELPIVSKPPRLIYSTDVENDGEIERLEPASIPVYGRKIEEVEPYYEDDDLYDEPLEQDN